MKNKKNKNKSGSKVTSTEVVTANTDDIKSENDNLDEKPTLFDKLLNVLVITNGVAVISVLIALVCVIMAKRNYTLAEEKSNYSCKTFEEQVEASNKSTFNWFLDKVDYEQSSVLYSPLAIQSTLYNKYNKQGIEASYLFKLFKYGGNGYKSWDESGKLFSSDCLKTIFADEVDSKDCLLGKLNSITDGGITELGDNSKVDDKLDYSIFSLGSKIKDAYCSPETGTIIYEGEMGYKKTSDYEAIKLDLSDDKHSVYFINGNFRNFEYSGFSNKKANVLIKPYGWQTTGTINIDVESNKQDDNIKLNILNQFSFSKDGYKSDKHNTKYKDYIYFADKYHIIITDNETGLALAYGKCIR